MDFPTDPTSANIKTPEPDINAEIDSVVDIALDMFARGGFSQTKLGAIAKETGMSSRLTACAASWTPCSTHSRTTPKPSSC